MAQIGTIKAPAIEAGVNMRGFNTLLVIKDIEGYSRFSKEAIDVVSFNMTLGTTGATKSMGPTNSRVEFDGVIIRKSIDKATPLLFNALAHRKLIESAALFLYRDPPKGDAAAELFYEISMGEVYVTRQILADPETSDGAAIPYEEVTLHANSIEYNHVLAKKVATFMFTTNR